jgi:predicted O-methyltransferase YrrM
LELVETKTILNRAALAFFRRTPPRLAKHLLFLLQSQPEIPDSWGFHIRPIHYYEPLPDFRTITESRLQRERDFPALEFNWTKQLDLIHELARNTSGELEELARANGSHAFDFANPYFCGLDAAVYYALIRRLEPERVIEIGGGYSTQIAAKALARNRREGKPGRLTCIEPFPEERLTMVGPEIELITMAVEELDVGYFSSLKANDILFIDSSHTVKFDSDVCREILQILPRLAPGVWIHVHDIFFPHDYPAEWLIERRLALNEQYLLEAFLAFNGAFGVRLGNYGIRFRYPVEIEQGWPQWMPMNPAASSFWIERVGQ